MFKTNRQIIVGRAIAAYESSAEELFSFEATPLSLLGKTGVYQLTTFPITRFNGVPLPPGARIRFADRTRLFKGVMPKRLFEILSGDGKGYYAWDAHAPVGKTPHDFYHVNQKGRHGLFGDSNHAPLTGGNLSQARYLRYLKLGGRLSLVVGVAVDSVQLEKAVVRSLKEGSVKPFADQAIRSASGWAAAWAGAKAGVALGGRAGIKVGPGIAMTAIGGLIGGVAGYFGGWQSIGRR